MPKKKEMSDRDEGLTKQQEEAGHRLKSLIQRFSAGLGDRTDEEKYAMFGLFGARGSGKSTVLNLVLDKLTQETKDILVCRPPLDCTTLPRHIPMGLSLVSHVKRSIEQHVESFVNGKVDPDLVSSGWRRASPHESSLRDHKERFQRAWQTLVERYVETDHRHRELQLSLAVTQSEYQSIAKHEIESRATLSVSVREWLDVSLSLASVVTAIPRRQILVALEDSDLGTGPVSLRVISTFLDELGDERLLFIVVADENNLEDRFRKGAQQEFSEHMIPQVLAKVVPVHHRVYLDPWNYSDALEFVPLASDQKSLGKTLAEVLEKRLAAYREQISLQVRDLMLLLPRYPRGLSDLYRGLLESTGDGDVPQEQATTFDASSLVLLLARARGDLSLARSLPLRPLSWWGLHLRWPEEGTSLGTWGQLIDRSWAGRPLWAFARLSLPFELKGEEDAVLWAELLLNLSFRFNPEAIRTFLRRFPPIKDQLATCSFRFKPTSYELIRLGQMPHEVLDSPWFLWRGTGRESAEIEAGWTPVVERSIGQPRSSLAAILKDLGASAPVAGPIQDDLLGDHAILPKDVRSLLLLTDKMSRLPWGDLLSWAEAQFLRSWPSLIAIFCGEAYIATLCECLMDEASASPLAGRIDSLRDLAADLATNALRDSSVESTEESLETLIREVDKIDWKRFDHPMAEATQAFFRSAVVRHLLSPELRQPPAEKT